MDATTAALVARGDHSGLDAATLALLDYAERLTVDPSSVAAEHVEALRTAGWDDRAILDANLVVSYFNLVNRIVDGLGVELEPTRRHGEVGEE